MNKRYNYFKIAVGVFLAMICVTVTSNAISGDMDIRSSKDRYSIESEARAIYVEMQTSGKCKNMNFNRRYDPFQFRLPKRPHGEKYYFKFFDLKYSYDKNDTAKKILRCESSKPANDNFFYRIWTPKSGVGLSKSEKLTYHIPILIVLSEKDTSISPIFGQADNIKGKMKISELLNQMDYFHYRGESQPHKLKVKAIYYLKQNSTTFKRLKNDILGCQNDQRLSVQIFLMTKDKSPKTSNLNQQTEYHPSKTKNTIKNFSVTVQVKMDEIYKGKYPPLTKDLVKKAVFVKSPRTEHLHADNVNNNGNSYVLTFNKLKPKTNYKLGVKHPSLYAKPIDILNYKNKNSLKKTISIEPKIIHVTVSLDTKDCLDSSKVRSLDVQVKWRTKNNMFVSPNYSKNIGKPFKNLFDIVPSSYYDEEITFYAKPSVFFDKKLTFKWDKVKKDPQKPWEASKMIFLKPKPCWTIENDSKSVKSLQLYHRIREDLIFSLAPGEEEKVFITRSEKQALSFPLYGEDKNWYYIKTIQDDNTSRVIKKQVAKMYKWKRLIIRIDPPDSKLKLDVSIEDDKKIFFSDQIQNISSYPPKIPKLPPVDSLKAGRTNNLVALYDNNGKNEKWKIAWKNDPKGFESKKKFLTLTPTDSSKTIKFERLPLLPLVYLSFSQNMDIVSLRKVGNILRQNIMKGYVAIGHDGKLQRDYICIDHSGHDLSPLLSYLNMNRNIGYSIIMENEVNDFLRHAQINVLEDEKMIKNQYCALVLIVSSRDLYTPLGKDFLESDFWRGLNDNYGISKVYILPLGTDGQLDNNLESTYTFVNNLGKIAQWALGKKVREVFTKIKRGGE